MNLVNLELTLPSLANRVYQCGTCGWLWAVIHGRRDTTVFHIIADCPNCPGAGSLLGDPMDTEWERVLEALSEADLRRELAIYLEAEQSLEHTATDQQPLVAVLGAGAFASPGG